MRTDINILTAHLFQQMAEVMLSSPLDNALPESSRVLRMIQGHGPLTTGSLTALGFEPHVLILNHTPRKPKARNQLLSAVLSNRRIKNKILRDNDDFHYSNRRENGFYDKENACFIDLRQRRSPLATLPDFPPQQALIETAKDNTIKIESPEKNSLHY